MACNAPLPAGARYCTQCARPVLDHTLRLPWVLAGLAMVALIVVLVWPAVRERSAPPPLAASTGAVVFPSQPGMTNQGAAQSGAPPPLTGTPREQADRLFNRAMGEDEAGNVDQAQFFADMAVTAYGMAGAADADALFHIGLLELVMGDGAGAVGSAERILDSSPTHLLGLAIAAMGSLAAGDTISAREYYGRFLDNYDAELGNPLPEYTDHSGVLPMYRDQARALISGN